MCTKKYWKNSDWKQKYNWKDMRITKEEYAVATHDDAILVIVEGKIHTAPSQLANTATPQAGGSMNLFSGFMTMLDKNLITIQEHHIDMKDALQKPNNTKTPKGIWQTLKESFTK